MAKKKSNRKQAKKTTSRPPTADTDTNVADIVKENADEHDNVFAKLADPGPSGPTPIKINPGDAKCDTCKRIGTVMKCEYCGKTYCNECRTPSHGHYKNCQFCGKAFA